MNKFTNGIVPEKEGRPGMFFPYHFKGDSIGQMSEPIPGRIGKCQFCHNSNYPNCVGKCEETARKIGDFYLNDPRIGAEGDE